MQSTTRIQIPVTAVLLLACSFVSAQSLWSESYRLEAEGDYRGAIEALEPVIDSDANHEFAILRRGWLEYLGTDYNASIRDYRRALQLNPDSIEAALGLTLPLLAQRRWREAAATAEQVLTVAPWNYYAQIRLMAAEEGLLRWQSLAERATEASKRFPSDATIQVYLARAEASQGNRNAAARAYERVIERYPDHDEALTYLSRFGR